MVETDQAGGAIAQEQFAAAARALPGVQPVVGPWLTVDGAYRAQLACKAALLKARRDDVLAVCDGAQAACAEALAVVLAGLAMRDDFAVGAEAVRRPDGVTVPIGAPLETLAALVQEDICILDKQGAEHVFVAGLLCFPASWTLTEKIGRPLGRIHRPVPQYAPVAARVQRLFDGVQVGRPLWRANALRYHAADLYQPHSESAPRIAAGDERYIRSERQTVLRLPQTGAVMFAIHTSVAAI